MRLLNVHYRQLREFYGLDNPPYAILSHTWGKEEVSFDDVAASAKGPWTQKRGYGKIDSMCRLVASKKPGLDWVWIDTLCIDKSSSAELTEAINSMFSWYSEAVVCYAYLDDVHASRLEEELPKARWFTRGWTLQELIAPRRVVFCDKDWTEFGTKETESADITDFTALLASITGIDKLVLWKPKHRQAKSVAARMSWASQRRTKRPEDLAYCLMGIFDVYMPLLYGEGARAFMRLQEEIVKTSDDHSIYAWDRESTGPRSVSCFAASPALFVEEI